MRAAQRFWFERRWPDGFTCPMCGNGDAASLKSRAHTHECLRCGRQTSITAGTLMHRTKLPLTVWIWAAHLMSTHSNGMSAQQRTDQLDLTYKTAWLLTQKLRRSSDRAELDCRAVCQAEFLSTLAWTLNARIERELDPNPARLAHDEMDLRPLA